MRVFVVGVVVLVAYNVARGLGAFGGFGDASTLLLLGAFVADAWWARFSLADLGLARADVRRGNVAALPYPPETFDVLRRREAHPPIELSLDLCRNPSVT